ncbi:hypothetical protein CsSME_00016340 [Camellia sinensis var. sinensis]
MRKEGKYMNEVLDATVGTNPSQRSSDLLQSSPHDNLPTSVNEVGFVTESIEAMKLSKRAGSSIANLSTGLDMMRDSSVEVTEENHDALQEAKAQATEAIFES